MPTRSLPLVGAGIIGSAFGIYQSVAMFNLAYMLCAVVSITILRWPRFGWWLAGFVVLLAVNNLPGQVDGPREVVAIALIWLVAPGAMVPLVWAGRRDLAARSALLQTRSIP